MDIKWATEVYNRGLGVEQGRPTKMVRRGTPGDYVQCAYVDASYIFLSILLSFLAVLALVFVL